MIALQVVRTTFGFHLRECTEVGYSLDSPDNVFLLETLHITPRRDDCLTQALVFSSTSNFFATIAALYNNMRSLKSTI